MTEIIPKPVSPRPYAARESGILIFEPTVEAGAVPTTHNPRPFHRIDKCVVIYDADNKPVSGVQNAEWFFHADQCHDPLKDALYRLVADFQLMARLAGYSQHVIDQAMAEPIAALAKAGVKVGP